MQYALVTVPPGWDARTSVGFSESAYERWHEEIEPGCRVLVYKSAPVNAIVAEAVVPDNVFLRLDEWPEQNREPVPTGQGQIADYVMPLKVISSYPVPDYVADSLICDMTDLENIDSREWIPLDVEVYRVLRSYPNESRSPEGG